MEALYRLLVLFPGNLVIWIIVFALHLLPSITFSLIRRSLQSRQGS